MIEFHRIFFFAKFNDMSTNHVTRSIAITVAAPFEIPFVNSIEMIRVPSLKKAITLFSTHDCIRETVDRIEIETGRPRREFEREAV